MPTYVIRKPRLKKTISLGEHSKGEEIYVIEVGKDKVIIGTSFEDIMRLKDPKIAIKALSEELKRLQSRIIRKDVEKYLQDFDRLSVGVSFEKIKIAFEEAIEEYIRYLKSNKERARKMKSFIREFEKFLKGLKKNDPYYLNLMINMIADPGPFKESVYKIFEDIISKKIGKRRFYAAKKQVEKLLERYITLKEAYEHSFYTGSFELLEGSKIELTGINPRSILGRYANLHKRAS